MLDDAGFPQARIVATNDLDERTIASIKEQGGQIAVWGVGTKLVTGHDQPALGGVYKLAAIRNPNGSWRTCVKLSEQAIKMSIPGIQNVRRFVNAGEAVGDVIWDELKAAPQTWTMVDPTDAMRSKQLPAGVAGEDLLLPVLRAGELVGLLPPLPEIQARTRAQLALFHNGVKRLDNPHRYPVGLEAGLHTRRTELVRAAKARPTEE